MKERLVDLEQYLFQLQRLEGEGKDTRVLQEEVWEEIKNEIENKVSKDKDVKRVIYRK